MEKLQLVVMASAAACVQAQLPAVAGGGMTKHDVVAKSWRGSLFTHQEHRTRVE